MGPILLWSIFLRHPKTIYIFGWRVFYCQSWGVSHKTLAQILEWVASNKYCHRVTFAFLANFLTIITSLHLGVEVTCTLMHLLELKEYNFFFLFLLNYTTTVFKVRIYQFIISLPRGNHLTIVTSLHLGVEGTRTHMLNLGVFVVEFSFDFYINCF